MNPIVFHIASGGSFFSGVFLLLGASLLMLLKQRGWKRTATLLICLGVIAVSLSATPLPYWLLALTITATVVWIITNWFDKWKRWATLILAITWTGAACWEGSHWITPVPQPVRERKLSIIGDSVTAGVHSEGTWPQRFGEQRQIAVQDLSGSGFTTLLAL